VANLSQDWEVAELKNVPTKYKAGEKRDIEEEVGVFIGLRGIKITLKGISIWLVRRKM
jgi:hypothetical protein